MIQQPLTQQQEFSPVSPEGSNEGRTGTAEKEQIKMMISRRMMNAISKNADRIGCHKSVYCRLAWAHGHQTVREILKEKGNISPAPYEKPNAKDWVPLVVRIDPEFKRDLKSDAKLLDRPLSEYLRNIIEIYSKNVRFER